MSSKSSRKKGKKNSKKDGGRKKSGRNNRNNNKEKDMSIKLQFIKEHAQGIGVAIGAGSLVIGAVNVALHGYENIIERLSTIETLVVEVEQMSLKSVIWNENVPLTDRIHACDTYAKREFNSYTKKYCDGIVQESSQQLPYSSYSLGERSEEGRVVDDE